MSSPVNSPEPFNASVTFCATDDLGATGFFYEKILGLELALDQGTCRIYRVAGCGFVGFCSRLEAPKPDGIILTLVTEDVDGWFEKIQAAGVVVDKPPTHNPDYNIYHCFVRDPNGYAVEIQRFDDPRWPG